MPSRSMSGGQTPTAFRGVEGVILSQISFESRRVDHTIALQTPSTMPTILVSYHEVKVSPKWPHWLGVLKHKIHG